MKKNEWKDKGKIQLYVFIPDNLSSLYFKCNIRDNAHSMLILFNSIKFSIRIHTTVNTTFYLKEAKNAKSLGDISACVCSLVSLNCGL